jgi:hypothetical protein
MNIAPQLARLKWTITAIACVALTASTMAFEKPEKPTNKGPEKPVLRDIYGIDRHYDSFAGQRRKAVVFVILDENCPVVKQQLPKLTALHNKYNSYKRDRAGHPTEFEAYPGDLIEFLGVYTRPDQSMKAIATHAMSSSIPFRVLRDTQLDFVKTFDLTRLSEVVVFNRDWQVIYQGPIDDQSVQGSTKSRVTENYLENVLDSIVGGANPPQQKVPPVGCLIEKELHRDYPQVTYADVEPILQRRCAPCHQAGEIGPMPLTSYSQVRDYALMIEEVVVEERMPPWPAASSHSLRSELALSSDEREVLLAWLRTKMPHGEITKSEPVGVRLEPASTWKIGKPDFIFEMPEPYTVPATGVIDYVYVPIEINGGKGFDEDRWIEAIEVRPGAPEVVHHIQVHEFRGKMVAGKVDPIQQLLHYGLSVENARLLGSYTPGNLEENARVYSTYVDNPADAAGMKLRRGSNLLLELHYTTNGKETKDRSSVGIRFAKSPPKVAIESWFPFRKRPDMVIPANVAHHSLQDRYHFGAQTDGKAVLLHGLRPHLHTRGKSYRIELIDANSITEHDMQKFEEHDRVRGEVILQTPLWDFNWQHFYRFEKPILIRPQQALLATAYWDNSKFNPRNPDPNANVSWGQQTDQEMFNTLFNYEVLEKNDPRLLADQKETR